MYTPADKIENFLRLCKWSLERHIEEGRVEDHIDKKYVYEYIEEHSTPHFFIG